jgi:hypothetical protein
LAFWKKGFRRMKVKTITCPNCGQANNFLAEDCLQCGINFSKYYDDLEKADALRRHIEAQEKAEAQRQRELAAKAAILKRQQEELERAEAQKRAEEEQARLREAEEERRRAEEEQARLREAEEERRRAEEEQARLREAEEERRRAEEEQARLREAEEERRRAEEEQARLREAEETRQSEAAVEDTDSDALDPVHLMPVASMTERLAQLVGQTIGINFGDPSDIRRGKVIAVHADHFQVLFLDSRHIVSCPLSGLGMVVEHNEGLSAVGDGIHPLFPAVLQMTRPFFLQS